MAGNVKIGTRRTLRSWEELRPIEKAWLFREHRALFEALRSESSSSTTRLSSGAAKPRLALQETLVNGKRFEELDTRELNALYLADRVAFKRLKEDRERRRGELRLAAAQEQEWEPAIAALSATTAGAVALCQPRVPAGDMRDPVNHLPGSWWPMEWGPPPPEAYAHCEGYDPNAKRYDIRRNERPPDPEPMSFPSTSKGTNPQETAAGRLLKKDRLGASELEPIKALVKDLRRTQPTNVKVKYREGATPQRRATFDATLKEFNESQIGQNINELVRQHPEIVVDIEDVEGRLGKGNKGKTKLDLSKDENGKHHIRIQVFELPLVDHNNRSRDLKSERHVHSPAEVVAHEMGHAAYLIKMATSDPEGMDAGWERASTDAAQDFGESSFSATYAGLAYRKEKNMGVVESVKDITEYDPTDNFALKGLKLSDKERDEFVKRARAALPYRDPFPAKEGPVPYNP